MSIDNKEFNVRLGLSVLKHRRSSGLTQGQLAQKLNVTKATISKYENGVRSPHIKTLLDICQILKVDISKFLQEIGNVEVIS